MCVYLACASHCRPEDCSLLLRRQSCEHWNDMHAEPLGGGGCFEPRGWTDRQRSITQPVHATDRVSAESVHSQHEQTISACPDLLAHKHGMYHSNTDRLGAERRDRCRSAGWSKLLNIAFIALTMHPEVHSCTGHA